MSPQRPIAWVVTDGVIGMENQCVGLVERIGMAFAVKRIAVRKPWRWVPPLLIPSPLGKLAARGDRLEAPWPDLLVASGRKSVAPALAIRRAAGGACFCVQVQNPGVATGRFDMVIAPRHDGLAGDNVVATTGSLHGLSRAGLDRDAEAWRAAVAHLAEPRIAVLVGGANRAYRFGVAEAQALGRALGGLPGSLMVTVSRRTGPEATQALAASLDLSRAVLWDGNGDNPYRGWLGLADAIVVTSDSVNMATEACVTGKPVLVAHLPGGSPKFAAFHALMEAQGHTRRFEGMLPDWSPLPLDETGRVADLVRARLEARAILK